MEEEKKNPTTEKQEGLIMRNECVNYISFKYFAFKVRSKNLKETP